MSMMVSPYRFGNGAPAPSSAQHWRLRFPSGSNGADLGIREIEMRATVGGSDLTTSTASASSTFTGFPSSGAFDNDINGGWYAADGSETNSWIANTFSSASDVAEIVVYPQVSGSSDNGPSEIVAEYSTDGSTWYTDTRWPTMTGLTWGSSSGTAVDYKTFRRAATPARVHSRILPTLNADSGGWTNFTLRLGVTAAGMPNGGGTNRIRFALKAGNAEGLTINKCYVGVKGTGTHDFATTPTQVTWDGGSNSTTISATNTKFSDTVTLSLTDSDSIVISIFIPSGASAADTFRRLAGATAMTGAYKAGDDATTQTISGYTTDNNTYLAGLEIWSA